MIGKLLAIALLAQAPTVAVTIAPDKPAMIMTRAKAESLFDTLCKNPSAEGVVRGTIGFDGQGRIVALKAQVTVSNGEMLKALAVALNPMPNWPQMVMNGDASVCQRNPKPLPMVSVGTTWP